MNNDLKIIKKKYGEAMMHFCRDHFSSLLEKEGLLSNLLLNHFNPSHTLYEDIINDDIECDFKNYIYSLSDLKNNNTTTVDKTPKQLMDEAGYTLIECKTESDIQKFRKYYREDEELCTFWTHRLYRCRVFFAVKKDVDKIKREDFKNPNRQDEYGTSVISIQFTKDGTNTLSIKNRYNHRVNNPDATFSNNLDNIIPGLTEAFEKEYGIVQAYKNDRFEIKNYVRANDGKFYKFNYEIRGIYYCPNNIIIDHHSVIKYPKEKYIVFDYFNLDLVHKKILYDRDDTDSFVDEIMNIEKIKVEAQKENKIIYIQKKDQKEIVITLDKENKMIGYKNENIEKVDRKFLYYNTSLVDLCLPNLKKIESKFLHNNLSLKTVFFPKVEIIGNDFMVNNHTLKNIDLPNVKSIGASFLNGNIELRKLKLPNLEIVDARFLAHNRAIYEVVFPKLKIVGESFLFNNNRLKKLSLPNVIEIGNNFIYSNILLNDLFLPQVERIDNRFLYRNQLLTELSLPNAREIGDDFLLSNLYLKKIELPKLKTIGTDFIFDNTALEKLSLPMTEKIGFRFLYNNERLRELDLPNVKVIDSEFLNNNDALKELSLPNVKEISSSFLPHNKQLEELDLPNVKIIGYRFLQRNIALKKLSLPKLEETGYNFLKKNRSLTEINIPENAEVDYEFKERYKELFNKEQPKQKKL